MSDRSLRPHVLADRYELIEMIGSGGSATVWRAQDPRLDRAVAVKILHPGLGSDRTFQRRMEREARHVASLKSAHLVPIFDVGSSPDGPFIVMELVKGTSLRQHLDTAGPLDPERTRGVARDVLSALIVAHRAGVVHRDLKPSNILITSGGITKLTDFGISRSITEGTEITAAGLFTGTIAYSAPEQIAGEATTEASDLYSLGCVLYECVCGHPPFASADVNQLAFQQRFADPVPIDNQVPGLPSDLAECVMGALEKDPRHRYESASAMLREIRGPRGELHPRVTSGLASATHEHPHERTTPEEKSRRESAPKRYRRRVLMMAASLVVVAVVVSGLVLWHPWTHRGSSSSVLNSGGVLISNDSLMSQNDEYRLVMQPTGVLTLEVARTGEPIWASGSSGHPGAYAVMQRDGNFVIRSPLGERHPASQQVALYQTSTSGQMGATLHVLDDGNLVIEDQRSGSWSWQSGSGPASLGSKLVPTQGLHPLQTMQSPNGRYELADDGWTGQLHLSAVVSPACSIWVEPATGLPASVSALLPDGEFVVLAPQARETWTSGTSGHPGSQLALRNDGSLALVSATGSVVWQAGGPTASLVCANK